MTDASHAVVPDAVVEIKDNTKGTSQSARTDHDGAYQFSFLAPGRYFLTVTRDGFRQDNRAVNIPLGPPVTANVTLELAKASTTIKVMGEAPLVQAENGDFSTTISQKEISEVPNPGNDLTYIAQTARVWVRLLRQPKGSACDTLPVEAHLRLVHVHALAGKMHGLRAVR